jgi:hypothetical protein
VHGNPLLSLGTPANMGISTFFVRDGRLIFLRRVDFPEGTYVHHGSAVSREITAAPSEGARVY